MYATNVSRVLHVTVGGLLKSSNESDFERIRVSSLLKSFVLMHKKYRQYKNKYRYGFGKQFNNFLQNVQVQ